MHKLQHTSIHLHKASKLFVPVMASFMMMACGAWDKSSKEKKASNPSGAGTPSGTGGITGASKNPTSLTNLSSSPKGFLTLQDLSKPKDLMEYTESSLDDGLQFLDDLFPKLARQSKSSDSNDEDEFDQKCMDAKIHSLPIKYQNQWLIYEGDLDITACHKKLPARSVVKSSKMKIFIANFLDQYMGDGSEFKDKKISDLEDISKKYLKPSGNDTVLTGEIMNMRLEQEYEPTENDSDEPSVAKKYISIGASLGSNGGACRGEAVGDDETVTDCVKTSILTFMNPSGLPLNQFTKSTFKNVTGPSKGPFFASGDIQFEIGDWTGKVSYTDKNTAPKWQAQKGAEIAQGQLKAFPR